MHSGASDVESILKNKSKFNSYIINITMKGIQCTAVTHMFYRFLNFIHFHRSREYVIVDD
jgi:hypothetical protein